MVDTPSAIFVQSALGRRDRIDAELARYATFGHGCPQELSGAIGHSLFAPGKRLRPILVLSAAEACGSDPQTAMPAACAVEMVHTYSLIHDDLPAMDDDDLRRGRPTCHAVYGEALAILAGDALLARAFELLATGIEPPAVAARCCGELARAAGPTRLVGGQADDLAAETTGGGLEQLESIHQRKTGAMLLVSLRLGALVAQADEGLMDSLEQYGTRLGLAFQIVDDLLDYTGNERTVGKRTGKDSGRGKLTFPGLLGIEASRRRAHELIDEACRELAPFGARADSLRALARYVLERSR